MRSKNKSKVMLLYLKELKDLGEEVAILDVGLSKFLLSMGYLLFRLRSSELIEEIDNLCREVKERENEIELNRFKRLSDSCVELMLKTNINPRLINYWISGAKSIEIMSGVCIPAIMRVLEDWGSRKELINTLEYGTSIVSLANRFIDAFGDCIYAVMDELSRGTPIEEINIETGSIDIFDEIILRANECWKVYQ